MHVRTSASAAPWIVLAIPTVLVGTIVLAAGLSRPDGFMRTSDVGDLPELQEVLGRIGRADMCGVENGSYGKHGRPSYGSLYVQDCTRADALGVPSWLLLEGRSRTYFQAPKGASNQVVYELHRRGPGKPFKLLVNKNYVALPKLKDALNELAFVLEKDFESKRSEERAMRQRWDTDVRTQRQKTKEKENEARKSWSR
jgi:hypothetical protein